MLNYPEQPKELELKDSNIITRYITAGKGEVVLRAPDGTAHMYAFLSPKNTKDFPEDTIFVYAVHEGKKYYLGMLEQDEKISFKRTSGSKFGEDTEAVRGARFIVKMANNQELTSSTVMTLYQTGKCCKCGRPLTADAGLSEGIGRKCLCKYNLNKVATPWDGNSAFG